MTRIQRLLAILLVAFFALGIFSFTDSMVESHHTMGDGTEHHVCPLMGTTPACVSIVEHLAHWQSSFVAVLEDVLPLIVLLSIAYACLWLLYRPLEELGRFVPTSPLNVLRLLLPRHALQEAFSSGLIHPKLF